MFLKYETSTDNLVPIENNRFQLNEKFPNITVRAYFKTRVPGNDELFFNDFGGDLGPQPDGIHTQDGELVVEVPKGSSSNAYRPEVDWTKISGNKGYRISVDARRMTGESGTMQIAFRGGDTYFKTRVPGKDELFFNDFGGDLGTQPDGIHTQDGELVVEVPKGSSSNAYRPEVDWTKISGNKGYRISVDARRMTGESGTMQIAFRGGDNFESRYVVAINSIHREALCCGNCTMAKMKN